MHHLKAIGNKHKQAFKQTNYPALLCLLPTSILLINFYLSILPHLSNSNQIESGGVVQYIEENLYIAPIMSITTTSSECSPGYEEHYIGDFPGVKKKNLDDPEIKPISLRYWADKKFCIKRLTNYKFQTGSCDTGFKACQKNLCVSNLEECPVTDLIPATDALKSTNPETILVNNREYIIVRDINTQPLYNIEFAYYNLPCLSRSKVPKTSWQKSFLDSVMGSEGCGEYANDHTNKIIDTISERKLYESNNIVNILEKADGYMDSLDGKSVSLVLRPRIALADSPMCLGPYSPSEEIGKPMEDMEKSYVHLVVITFIQLIFSLYCIGSLWIITAGNEESMKKVHDWTGNIFRLYILLDLFFMVIAWYTVGANAKKLPEMDILTVNLAKNNCFMDPLLTSAVQNYEQFMAHAPSGILGAFNLIIWITAIRGVFVTLLIYFRKKGFPFIPMPIQV